MDLERRDSINRYFNDVDKAEKINKVLFFFTFIGSFAILFTSDFPSVNRWLNISFILLTILYFLSSNRANLNLLMNAQNKRRVHLLSNGLGVNLDNEDTNLYYNNPYTPSILRLGWNVFESSMFTYKISEEMLKASRIKLLVAILILVLFMLLDSININFIALVAQSIFTTNLALNHWKLEVLHKSAKEVFEDFQHFFLVIGEKTDNTSQALILKFIMRYETAVAGMGIQLSTKKFNELNPKLNLDWEVVKRNLLEQINRNIS